VLSDRLEEGAVSAPDSSRALSIAGPEINALVDFMIEQRVFYASGDVSVQRSSLRDTDPTPTNEE